MGLGDRYTILEKLGEGGMAEVYRAQHLLLEREVAIKFVHRAMNDPEFDLRFKREAQAIARLEHPNIVHIYDFDKDPTRGYFMVMELLEGRDLGHTLRKLQRQNQFMPLADVLLITRSVADALGYAHEQGVIHRDIKPSNIFLTENKRVVVTDFGIARLSNKPTLTTGDMLVGTPHYLAPEVSQGLTPDHRVDIYALGAMFYQMLTNQCPYEHENPLEVIAQHIGSPIPDPLKIRPELPPALRMIVQNALAKNPSHRYPDFSIMSAELEDVAIDNDIPLELPKSRTPTPRPNSRPTTIQIARPTPAPNPTPVMISPDDDKPETLIISTPITLTSQKHGDPTWRVFMGGIVVLMLGFFGFLALQSNTKDTPLTPAPTATAPLTVQPAQPGEYLYLVANVTNDQHSEVNVPHQLLNALQDGGLQSLLGTRFRAEYVDRTIQTKADAQALAEETGALMIVWGVEDATGLDVILYVPRYVEDSLNELHFMVTIDADYADIVANDLRQFIPNVAEIMTNQQLLVDNIFLSSGDFGRLVQPDWEDTSTLRIRPATALEAEVLQFINVVSAKDYDQFDQQVSLILEMRPAEYSLYLMRFAINLLIRGRIELARSDVAALEQLLPSQVLPLWCNTMLYLAEEDYLGLYTATFTTDNSATVETQVMSYYHALAALMLGKYDEALLIAQNFDGSGINILFDFPIQENMLSILYEIQGDDEAMQSMYSILRADRRITRLANNFAKARSPHPPTTMVLWLAHALEVNGETLTAQLAYRLLLNRDENFYFSHWRLANMAESAGDYTQARAFYQQAIDGAPFPFPIAQYQLALLLQTHPELEPTEGEVCTLLADATTATNTNPEFYGILLEQIISLQTEAGCN